MTEDEILATILKNEGGFKNDPEDPADPTNFGITAAVAGEWFHLGRRATAVEMQTLITEEVAKAVYRKLYIEDPGFTRENIPFEPLRQTLIDFGANSGPARATRWLQRVLRITATGVLDTETHDALARSSMLLDGKVFSTYGAVVNDALVAARIYMIDTSDSIHQKYKDGLRARALRFFLARPVITPPLVDSASRKA